MESMLSLILLVSLVGISEASYLIWYGNRHPPINFPSRLLGRTYLQNNETVIMPNPMDDGVTLLEDGSIYAFDYYNTDFECVFYTKLWPRSFWGGGDRLIVSFQCSDRFVLGTTLWNTGDVYSPACTYGHKVIYSPEVCLTPHYYDLANGLDARHYY
jgi:hypothetical protein